MASARRPGWSGSGGPSPVRWTRWRPTRTASAGRRRIDQIAAGCALGYLDFRFGQEDWREGRPALAAWYGVYANRASMRATVPPA
ncbi:MAG TPA: glutathione S-transferase C-terminal domain-containing protein [Geminicoccaceae bacterium]|nr:glutathione S-transferase C-terminal domain-containing protein [Geminicoccaceae bacterium]